LLTKFTPNLVKVLRKHSGLTKPLSDKSVNLNAFNNVFSSLYLPFDFRLNLFLSSFSNLKIYIFEKIVKLFMSYSILFDKSWDIFAIIYFIIE
jgi:hypothetical protein